MQYWIEKTIVSGRPDRQSGDFALGKALWSPQRGKNGADIYRFMREVAADNIVLHLTDNKGFSGISQAASAVTEFEGVEGTEWGVGPSYLVPLKGFRRLDPPLLRTDFFASPFKERLSTLINSGYKNLFYSREQSLNQGAYLTPAPTALIDILNDAYKQLSGRALIDPELLGPVAAKRAWMFQGNLNRYDMRGALRELREVTWSVNQFKDEIHAGDRVYFWQAGSDGGIVGVGDILDEPKVRMPLEPELKFAIDDTFRQEHLSVLIRKEKFVDPSISREQVLGIADLTNLAVLKFANATNFRVTEAEAVAIEKLLAGKHKRYWKIAPGEKASIWSRCLGDEQGGCIRIGWDELGDLSRFSTEDDFHTEFERHHQRSRKWREPWEFLHISEGDAVLANKGMTSIVGVGAVTKPYYFDPTFAEYPNCLGVKWFDVQERPIPDDAKNLVKDWFAYTVKELSASDFKQLATSQRTSMDKGESVNLILYGPPGTGKTYQTVERTVGIVYPGFSGDRHESKQKFDELRRLGRVEFITFHQSFSYEDFVEGIRPVLDVDDEGGPPRYECRPGTFKRLAVNALFDCLEKTEEAKGLPTFDALWNALLSKIESEPEARYPGLSQKTSYQLNLTPRGNLEGTNVLSDKKFLCTRKILQQVFEAKRSQDSVTASEVMEVVRRGCHSHFVAAVFNELRRLEKSQFRGELQTPREIIYTEEQKSEIVQQFLAQDEKSGYKMKPKTQWNRYVLVIDEINRGNISKILGELITLLEPDKRLQAGDNQNSLVVTLPYSGEKFAVPANLFVVATMNTADKSIALVDVALRRRFEFEELRVDLTLCAGLSEKMRSALKELNRRIALRKDRDHQIGHAYFISVADETSFNQRFRKQIIPLLQEYFYNDWEGLRYVLGENSATATDGRFIRKVSGADVKEARTKWQWFFDADTGDIDCLQTLCSNYPII